MPKKFDFFCHQLQSKKFLIISKFSNYYYIYIFIAIRLLDEIGSSWWGIIQNCLTISSVCGAIVRTTDFRTTILYQNKKYITNCDYFSDFYELSSSVLFDVQVKPFWLYLKHFGGQFLLIGLLLLTYIEQKHKINQRRSAICVTA